MRKFFERLRRAIKAFRAPAPTYAVIYDRILNWGNEDSEEYYAYFDSEGEALMLFGDAFGKDTTVHNAYLVQLVRCIKPSVY